FIDQFTNGDARGRELHAGIPDAARNRIRAQAVTVIAAVALPPFRALLDDVAHPPQRLDIVDQRRQAEQADLERIRRLVPGQAALTFQALQQRGLLATDVGAGTAAHVQCGPARRQFRDLPLEYLARCRIFIAEI